LPRRQISSNPQDIGILAGVIRPTGFSRLPAWHGDFPLEFRIVKTDVMLALQYIHHRFDFPTGICQIVEMASVCVRFDEPASNKLSMMPRFRAWCESPTLHAEGLATTR
jgi:hypothetical protein